MVVIKNPDMFELKGFEKSHRKDKKYNALLKNKINNNKRINNPIKK